MSMVSYHKSEHGEAITLTEAARAHVLDYLARKGATGLRFSVKKSGCSGLSYVIDDVLEQNINEQDVVQPISAELMLYIDQKSYPFIKGMTLDYVKQGLNHKFMFINPNQTGQCGCGESFTVD